MSPARILVVDDDAPFVRAQVILLEDEGFAAESAHSGDAALARLEQPPPVDLVLTDLAMPGMDGLQLLAELRRRRPSLPVIMMTGHGSIDTAVEAMRRGANQYLTKPVDPDELLVQIRRALEAARLEQENRQLRERLGDPARFDQLVGNSSAMAELRRLIERVAAVDSTVLIRGETGTGKELVARLIHASSPRADRPFVVVNCTAIPRDLLESELFGHVKGAFTGATAHRVGRFEQADGGTLLLDEVGDMPTELQPKLLRVLQDRRVQRIGADRERELDVRVLAATHRDLEGAIADGDFREDLFHRLNTIPVAIPPLRERLDDLPGLAGHLLAKVAHRMGRAIPKLTARAEDALRAMAFPGNVRELENLLERALVLEDPGPDGLDLVAVEDIRPPSRTGSRLDQLPLEGGFTALGERHRAAEEALIRRALRTWPGRSNADIAQRLGTNRRILEKRIADHGIDKKDP
jgi:DNA-binding NtrC family response regulator